MTIHLTDVQTGQLLDALLETVGFLTYRDRMNAHIHCESPRFSPLTEKVHETLHMLDKVVVEQKDQEPPPPVDDPDVVCASCHRAGCVAGWSDRCENAKSVGTYRVSERLSDEVKE